MSNKILIETSARHVHVTKEVLEVLFGKGHELTSKKALSQPGQFASNDKIKVVGPKGELMLSILGPCRDHSQVEVSFSDARVLGVNAPVRESGHIADSGACVLVGPEGQVELKEGVIVAKRHIHMTPAEAETFGVKDGEIVAVNCESKFERHLVFNDVVIRVSPKYALAMHIDTDECNAGGLAGEIYGVIVK